jgi:hypothetical protein
MSAGGTVFRSYVVACSSRQRAGVAEPDAAEAEAAEIGASSSRKRKASTRAPLPDHLLADVIARIADHPINRVDELLPGNWSPIPAQAKAA